MEIFRDVNIDWIGKTKYFLAGSLLLLLIGGVSWYAKGGLRYGIDFKGGTIVNVRFAEPPKIDQIRAALAAQGLGSSVIQQVRDITSPDSHEVLINVEQHVEQKGSEEGSLDTAKNAILNALRATLPLPEPAKQDFNAINSAALADFLARRDPLLLGTTAGNRYVELARDIIEFRDTTHNGLLTRMDDLRSVNGVNEAVLATLRDTFTLGPYAIRNVEIVGPKVGQQLKRQALLATLYALGGMLIYIAFRFELVYGAAAVLAVFHDVLITLGFFSLFDYEISLTVTAALLTLVGYSMNDTIVIFDRMRENLRLMRREPMRVIANRSINQTLNRTILTSGLTFLTVLVLYLLGGEVLRSFSFALVVGIVVGTYSSFGIAVPLVVAWNHWRGHQAARSGGVGSKVDRTKPTSASNDRLVAAGRR